MQLHHAKAVRVSLGKPCVCVAQLLTLCIPRVCLQFTLKSVKKAMRKKGFSVTVWEKEPTMATFQQVMRGASQLWVIAEQEYFQKRAVLSQPMVEAIVRVAREEKKGLYVLQWCLAHSSNSSTHCCDI